MMRRMKASNIDKQGNPITGSEWLRLADELLKRLAREEAE